MRVKMQRKISNMQLIILNKKATYKLRHLC